MELQCATQVGRVERLGCLLKVGEANLRQRLANSGRLAEAEAHFEELLAICYRNRTDPAIKKTLPKAMNSLANLYRQAGRYDEAGSLYQRALNEMGPDGHRSSEYWTWRDGSSGSSLSASSSSRSAASHSQRSL